MKTSPLYVCFLAAFFAVQIPAQDMTIDPSGPVNAANNIPAGLPSSGIAQGSIFIVKGTNLCAAGYTKRDIFPVETSLKGTTVDVTVGGRTVSALMVYVYGGLKDSEGNTFDQIAAILPSTAAAGDGTMTIRYNYRNVSTPVRVLASGPGLFTLSQSGRGPGVITDNLTYSVNTVVNSFNEKTWTNLWVTGLGPLPAGKTDDIAPPVGNLDVRFELYLGGKVVDSSRIVYWGRAPGNPGLDQIAFQPPPGVTGCNIPVFLKVGTFISNTVTMSLGSTLRCSDPVGPTPTQLDRIEKGLPVNTGRVVVSRVDMKTQTTDSGGAVKTSQGTADVGYARFSRYEAAYAPMSQEVAGPPSLGTCIVFSGMVKSDATFEDAMNLTVDPVPHKALDAGPNLNLYGPGGQRTLAAPAAPVNGFPTVEITFENQGSDNAHMFITGADTFSTANRLAPGGTRVLTLPWVNGVTIPFTAGRNGVVSASGSVKITTSINKVRVVFDESPTLRVTPSGPTPAKGLALFQTTLSSGYYKLLGADLKGADIDPDAKIDPLYLSSGTLNLSAPKSADIGAWQTNISIPTTNAVVWLDRDTTSSIDRSKDFLVRWTGGDPAKEHVVIYGHSAGTQTGVKVPGVSFVCSEAADAKQFSVPANILSQLPASKAASSGFFSLGTSPLSNQGNFTAEGCESGKFGFSQTVLRSVTYK